MRGFVAISYLIMVIGLSSTLAFIVLYLVQFPGIGAWSSPLIATIVFSGLALFFLSSLLYAKTRSQILSCSLWKIDFPAIEIISRSGKSVAKTVRERVNEMAISGGKIQGVLKLIHGGSDVVILNPESCGLFQAYDPELLKEVDWRSPHSCGVRWPSST